MREIAGRWQAPRHDVLAAHAEARSAGIRERATNPRLPRFGHCAPEVLERLRSTERLEPCVGGHSACVRAACEGAESLRSDPSTRRHSVRRRRQANRDLPSLSDCEALGCDSCEFQKRSRSNTPRVRPGCEAALVKGPSTNRWVLSSPCHTFSLGSSAAGEDPHRSRASAVERGQRCLPLQRFDGAVASGEPMRSTRSR